MLPRKKFRCLMAVNVASSSFRPVAEKVFSHKEECISHSRGCADRLCEQSQQTLYIYIYVSKSR